MNAEGGKQEAGGRRHPAEGPEASSTVDLADSGVI